MSPTSSNTRAAETPARPAPKTIAVFVLLGLTVIYLVLQVLLVQPYLWPAGHGAVIAGDSRFVGGSGDVRLMLARPPAPSDHPVGVTVIQRVFPDSPADRAGVRQGDEILAERNLDTGASVDLRELMMGEAADQIAIWREAYRTGLRGRLEVTLFKSDQSESVVTLDRPSGWMSRPAIREEWLKRHLGLTIQLIVFTGGALVLFLLRSRDTTASLMIAALALCAVGGSGSLLGEERVVPLLSQVITLFSWVATPLAFPITGLAIMYFPARSDLLARRRWLHAVPFLAASPMIATGVLTGLYLAGADSLQGAAIWDAEHEAVYFSSFIAALLINVAAMVEGTWRFNRITDVNERNRIRIVVLTSVPGVLAYAIRVGVPAIARLRGSSFELPWLADAFLQLLVLLPAFGLTYAVAVHRVLAPRLVIRRSIQYALARKTLTAVAVLPAAALLFALVKQREMTLGAIVTGAPLFYTSLILISVAAFKYRDRARAWLDQRFFREEYDAQKILVSLVSRVRFETDPSELTTLVVSQIDAALHPETTAILISGVDENTLTPVTVLNGSVETLPLDGGLVSMLRWSDEPLELYLDDPKSPAHWLPPDEREWLECTTAVLLVPILGDERSLIGMIALGRKRSDEAYTAEDRQLLANIASQVGLGLDVARLRRRLTDSPDSTTMAASAGGTPMAAPLAECPRCGRCEDVTVKTCPTDGAQLVVVPSMPRIIDDKYRVNQLLGRGGMGGVYRAHDVRLDRDVAIKVVRADLLGHPEARRRFRREAQIVARLQHPAIVSIFDYGTFADGSAFLVMEFVRGDDLRRALKRAGAFEPREAVRLMTAICHAIEAAHREGILHRDLKPENVLMPGADVEVKILDFGVAKLLDTGTQSNATIADSMMTIEGSIVGTPAYMAPEQLKGGAVDGRTDVFGLGVMTYELLTGRLPFGTGSIADIAVRQTLGVTPLTAPGRTVAPEVEAAVRTALQTDPALRPPSPIAFATLLQASLRE